MTRRTIHLVQRGVEPPLRCLACGEITQIRKECGEPVNLRGLPATCMNRSDWNTIYRDHAEYRRCVDPPDERDRSTRSFPPPTEPGFYWSEWRVAEDGTFDGDQNDTTPQMTIEVVEVFDRGSLDEPEFRVAVAGIAKSQGLDCFVWRSGKLEAPK